MIKGAGKLFVICLCIILIGVTVKAVQDPSWLANKDGKQSILSDSKMARTTIPAYGIIALLTLISLVSPPEAEISVSVRQ